MSIEIDKNIQMIIEIIEKYGKPNPQFPNDKDLEYGKLSKLVTCGGLASILKTMKKKKMVDFSDQGLFKDNSIITLIGDYNAPAISQQIIYEEINEKVKGEITSHQKAVQ